MYQCLCAEGMPERCPCNAPAPTRSRGSGVMTDRDRLAHHLANVNAILAHVSVDANLAGFATPEELARFRRWVECARGAVAAAELAVTDLVFDVPQVTR